MNLGSLILQDVLVSFTLLFGTNKYSTVKELMIIYIYMIMEKRYENCSSYN